MHTPRKQFKSDVAAEVGIGTMIVFIATILVAAIAAGVLISTSQKLQAKSTQTGNEATQNVVGSLTVLGVQGVREGAATDIYRLEVSVQLAAGANPVDLDNLVVRYSDGSTAIAYAACAATASTTEFAADFIRGAGTDCDVMSSGDLATISVGLADGSICADGTDMAPATCIPTNTQVTLQLVPNVGQTTLYSFTTPPGYGDKIIVEL